MLGETAKAMGNDVHSFVDPKSVNVNPCQAQMIAVIVCVMRLRVSCSQRKALL